MHINPLFPFLKFNHHLHINMKRITYLLLIFAGLLASCNTNKNKSRSGAQRTDPTVMLDSITKARTRIDSLFNQNKERLIVFAKIAGQEEPIRITNRKFPKQVHTTFNILKDSSGNIITISEFPYSESGDWSIILTHYFDKMGRTFAHKRQADFYNSICTDGMAHQTRLEYYDNPLKLIERTEALVDDQNNPLKKDNCQFPYEYEYKISEDLGKYLSINKLPINKR